MPKVKIFRFQVYIPDTDEMRTSHRWGTRDAIETIAHGQVIEETAVEVDANVVQSDIPGLTVRDFDPFPRTGFQTQVLDRHRPY